jgi:hypothetical protein
MNRDCEMLREHPELALGFLGMPDQRCALEDVHVGVF